MSSYAGKPGNRSADSAVRNRAAGTRLNISNFGMSQLPDLWLSHWQTMKTFLSSLLAASILLVSPHAGFAATNKTAAKSTGIFKGKVTAVNERAHTITITRKKSGESKTFHVRHASITVDKQKHKHLADVKVGMRAKVKEGRNGRLHISAKSHSGKKRKP
jgi:hypothetical protein